MANQIYKVLTGYGIYGASAILSGSAIPGGDGSYQDAAELGSIYMRTSGIVYIKIDTTDTVADWAALTASSDASELGYIRSFIGKASSGNTMPDYATNYHVTDGTDLSAAISALDAGLQAFGQPAIVSNVTTITTVDSINCRAYDSVKWFVTCTDHSNHANKQAVEIYAIHDGTSTVDAANLEYNTSSTIGVGVIPSGLVYSVDIQGTGSSQVMILQITSSTAVDVKVARIKL